MTIQHKNKLRRRKKVGGLARLNPCRLVIVLGTRYIKERKVLFKNNSVTIQQTKLI
jgi:hypothetical protein